ncbi:MAG: hypothetical protein NVSMB68_11280 [Thermoanaerobaculia bacterium]
MFYVLLAAVITWSDFFTRVTPHGAEYSDKPRQLAGTRVVLRGYAVANPPIEGGILLTQFPYSKSLELEETDVPYDAVAIIWRQNFEIPPIPSRPTIEGTLRLGNRTHSGQTTMITLEDCVPAASHNP